MQSKDQVVILGGVSTFLKSDRSKSLAKQVRKRRLPSYFPVSAWTSNFNVSRSKMKLIW